MLPILLLAQKSLKLFELVTVQKLLLKILALISSHGRVFHLHLKMGAFKVAGDPHSYKQVQNSPFTQQHKPDMYHQAVKKQLDIV
jgi:hypothetical protein